MVKRWRLGAALAIAMVGWPAGPVGTGAAAAPPPPQLRQSGRWTVDNQGRVVILHGVNAAWKVAPYVAPATAAGFTAADADFLARNGLNAVRLGVLFGGVMPQPGQIDESYLDRIDRIVQLLADRHVWVQLDMHQDNYSEQFQGEGFPAWAVNDGGLPNDAHFGFPGNEFASSATQKAFDNLWANSDGLWARYQAALTAVAAKWAGQAYFMGYDLFNEPFPGTGWQQCFSLVTGCPDFDHTLQQFEDQARAAIRTVDPLNIAWFEGNVISNSGPPSHLGDTAVADANIGFSWHDYCGTGALTGNPGPDCPTEEQVAYTNGATTDDRLKAAFLLSEFGANNDPGDTGNMAALADDHLLSWMVWAYKGWSDPTGQAALEGMFDNDADLSTLRQPKADVLIRPYPQAVAGIPTAIHFDLPTKVFTMAYTATPGAGDTEIFVPDRHYPNGYIATVRGATVVSPPGATILKLRTTGSAAVTVEVRPGSTLPASGAAGGAGARGASSGALPATGWPASGWPPAAPLGGLGLAAALLGRQMARRRQPVGAVPH